MAKEFENIIDNLTFRDLPGQFSDAKLERTRKRLGTVAKDERYIKRIQKGPNTKYWPFNTDSVLMSQKDVEAAFDVRNFILKNKGFVSNTESMANILYGKSAAGKPLNRKGTERALVLALDAFPELKNFRFATDAYPNIDVKKFKYLEMVSKSFADYKTNPMREEALASLMPDNMIMNYELSPSITKTRTTKGREKGFFNIAGKLNPQDRKFVSQRVSQLIGKNFSIDDVATAIEDANIVRSEAGREISTAKRNKKMLQEIQELHDDKVIQRLLEKDFDKKTQQKLLERAAKVTDQDIAGGSRRLFQMAEAMSSSVNSYKGLNIPLNDKIADRIIATGRDIGTANNRYAMSGLVYNHYSKVVDKALGTPNKRKFIGYYQNNIKKLLDEGKVPDEVFSVTASGRRGMSPYAIFTQALDADVNSKIKGGTIDSQLSQTHKKIQNITRKGGVVRNYADLTTKEKGLVDGYVETFEDVKKNAIKTIKDPKVRKSIQTAEFDLKNPPSKSIERYAEFDPKTRAAFDESYAKTGYAMKVPKSFVTQKEVLTKFEGGEVDKKLAKRLREAGFKCKFSAKSGGISRCDDPMNYIDDIKRNQRLVLSGSPKAKARSLSKFRAVKSFISGTLGPGAIAFEAAVAAPFALYGYGTGADKDEIISDLTFGIGGRSIEERMKEKYGEDIYAPREFLDKGDRLSNLERLQGGTEGQKRRSKGKFDILQPQFQELGTKMGYVDEQGIVTEEGAKKYIQDSVELQNKEIEDAMIKAETAEERKDNLTGLEEIGMKSGGLMNLTRTTPPKRSLNRDSQGLASLLEYDR